MDTYVVERDGSTPRSSQAEEAKLAPPASGRHHARTSS